MVERRRSGCVTPFSWASLGKFVKLSISMLHLIMRPTVAPLTLVLLISGLDDATTAAEPPSASGAVEAAAAASTGDL